jgi:hypothetical protein
VKAGRFFCARRIVSLPTAPQTRTTRRPKSTRRKKYFRTTLVLKSRYVTTGTQYVATAQRYVATAWVQARDNFVAPLQREARAHSNTDDTAKLFRLIRDTNPLNFSRPRQCGRLEAKCNELT